MSELFLKDEERELILQESQVINVTGEVTIREKNQSNNNSYIINLAENSVLNYYKYDKALKSNLKIEINMTKNSTINYYYSFECFQACKIELLSNINSHNNKSNIKINGVTSKKGTCYIEANAIIKAKTNDNEINEDIRILKLNNEESVIKPNLSVSTYNVKATHNTTCKMVDKQSLFYLMSKGLSKSKSIKLIKDGFLNKNIK